MKNDSYIICGDYNLVVDPNLDYHNYKHIANQKARQVILNSIEDRQLSDPYREHFSSQKRYAWRRTNPIQQSRFDFFLTTPDFINNFKDVEICHSFNSDHSPVKVNLVFDDSPYSPGLWKFNNSRLKDMEYINKVKQVIETTKQQYAAPVYNFNHHDDIDNLELQLIINDSLFLDTLLLNILGETITYGSYKQKQLKDREAKISKCLETIEQHLCENNLAEYQALRLELMEIRHRQLKGHLIRSRSQTIEENEKPTAYFLNLEKSNYINKSINKLQKDDGSVIGNQNDIRAEIKYFYQELYSSNEMESDFELDIQEETYHTLTNTDSANLESSLTLEEISLTLKNMKKDRSPGSSGFTVNFFKVFWKYISGFVLRAINYY